MKERLLTLFLAAGAFLLFYAFFVPKPAIQQELPELPTSGEKGDAGYQALWRWLQTQHIPETILREPYTRLFRDATLARATGNLLISTLPHRVPARKGELDDLDAWISRGNTLLVVAALDDTPRWSLGGNDGFLRTLGRMTRITFEPSTAVALHRPADPQRITLTAKGSNPLWDGVHSVLAVSEFPASRWLAHSMDASPILEIGELATGPGLWLKRLGNGQILVSGVATPFSNKLLAEQDNARLMGNIIAWSRTEGGTVIFDDDHQGSVSYYDAKAFFGDPRLHRTLLWCTGIWLLYVLGWQRLRARSDDWGPLDVTTFIKLTGGFFAGALKPHVVGTRLLANFFNSLRRSLNLVEDGTPLWEWLAADARVPAARLDELRRLHEKSHAGKNIDLIRLQNLLSRLTGTLE